MRTYRYVGAAEIRDRCSNQPGGALIETLADLHAWLATVEREVSADEVIATFVIDGSGQLRLANRRSEHVACASGLPVLSAGEMTFDYGNEVVEVTNQSTGYCPEPDSWKAVEAALNQIGVPHPGAFTREIVFRRCPSCNQINVVKDEWFECAICAQQLPCEGNLHESENETAN